MSRGRKGGKPSKRGAHGIQWRRQSVPEEWANARECREMLERAHRTRPFARACES